LRDAQNRSKNRSYKSYPIGSFVLVKDFSQRVNKKVKPSYLKAPFEVVNEYFSTVYVQDYLGRVYKHSKNNIRMASERSLELYGQLPIDVKMILGDVFNTEKWSEIKDTGKLPQYLESIELFEQLDRITRSGILPTDTHLLEQPDDTPNKEILDEDDILDDFLDSEVLTQLQDLHNNTLLVNDNISIGDVAKLHKENLPEISRAADLLADLDELDPPSNLIPPSVQNPPSAPESAEVEPVIEKKVRFNI
jgi:hypothetical protein